MKFDTATAEMAKQKTSELFAEIRKICSTDKTQRVNIGSDETNCTITNNLVSLIVELNALNGELSVSEHNYRVNIPSEPISGFHFPPKALSKACFVLHTQSGCTLGWRERGRTAHPFLSVAELAEKCVNQFIALEQRDEDGQIKRKWRDNERPSRS
jgi:hypothetical protein